MISFIEEDGHWLIDACYVKLKKNKLIIFFIVPRLGFFGSCFSFGLVFLRCCSCYSESFFFGQFGKREINGHLRARSDLCSKEPIPW